MRILILAAVAAMAFGSTAVAVPVCKTGVLCGNSCISKTKVCHKGTTAAATPAASKAPAAKPAAAATAAKPATPAKPVATAKAKPAHCKVGGKGAYVKCGTPGARTV